MSGVNLQQKSAAQKLPVKWYQKKFQQAPVKLSAISCWIKTQTDLCKKTKTYLERYFINWPLGFINRQLDILCTL